MFPWLRLKIVKGSDTPAPHEVEFLPIRNRLSWKV